MNVKLKWQLFNLLPKQNKTLYRLCRQYTDQFDGVNNSDMATNGEVRILQTILPHCNLVFDVGANVGDWTKSALTINPQLIIHAFEPHLATFDSLSRQTFPAQIIRQPFGFSALEEEKTLYVAENHTGMNSVYQREGLSVLQQTGEVKPTHIQLKTIDNYCQANSIELIDFLKIDVEGHDLAVLTGAQEMLKNGRIRVIQFEYGGACIDARVFLKDFFELLQPYQYQLYKTHTDHLQFMPSYAQTLETFQYQNWLAIHTKQGASLLKNDEFTQK